MPSVCDVDCSEATIAAQCLPSGSVSQPVLSLVCKDVHGTIGIFSQLSHFIGKEGRNSIFLVKIEEMFP